MGEEAAAQQAADNPFGAQPAAPAAAHVSSTKPWSPIKVFMKDGEKKFDKDNVGQRVANGLLGFTLLGGCLTATHSWFCAGWFHWSLVLLLPLLVFKYSANYEVHAVKIAALTLFTATTMTATALWLDPKITSSTMSWTGGAFGASLTLLLAILLPRLLLLLIQKIKGDMLGGDVTKFEVFAGFTILTTGLGFSASRGLQLWDGQGYLISIPLMLMLGLFLRHFIPLPAAGPNRDLVNRLSWLFVGTLVTPFAFATFPMVPGWICAVFLGTWFVGILLWRGCSSSAPAQGGGLLGG